MVKTLGISKEKYEAIFGQHDMSRVRAKVALESQRRRLARSEGLRAVRSEAVPCPSIRRDSVDVLSMVDGRRYTSRSDYDAHLAASGKRIFEPGENPNPKSEGVSLKAVTTSLRESKQKVDQGYRPPQSESLPKNTRIIDVPNNGE